MRSCECVVCFHYHAGGLHMLMLLPFERVPFMNPSGGISACQPVPPVCAGTAAAIARAAVVLGAWRPAGMARLAGGALHTLRAGMPPSLHSHNEHHHAMLWALVTRSRAERPAQMMSNVTATT